MSKNLPKIQELYSDKLTTQKDDVLQVLLNQPPDARWVKEHPFIRGYKYLPIERVEYLLKTIFKRYRIEVTGQGTAFNGVWVTVRVHYVHPITGEWEFHDGIGASQIQTKKGASPADLSNINNNAIGMAFPMAKTEAVKNACKSFGKLFGSDISRKEDILYSVDLTLIDFNEEHPNWNKAIEAIKGGGYTIEDLKTKYKIDDETERRISELVQM